MLLRFEATITLLPEAVGIVGTVVTKLKSTSDATAVSRVSGTIDYDYCYKIPVGTIKIKTVPQ